MTKLEQAARQALEALETLDCGDSYKTHNAAASLREALKVTESNISVHKLAEQAEQEPAEKSYYIEGVEHGFAKGVERCAKLIESGEFGIGHMMSMHDDESVAQSLRELYAALAHTKDLTDDLDWITPEAVFEAKLKLHGIANPPVQQVDLYEIGFNAGFKDGVINERSKQVDLTDDEIMKINVDTAGIVPTCDRQFHFARAVIAAYKEKNK